MTYVSNSNQCSCRGQHPGHWGAGGSNCGCNIFPPKRPPRRDVFYRGPCPPDPNCTVRPPIWGGGWGWPGWGGGNCGRGGCGCACARCENNDCQGRCEHDCKQNCRCQCRMKCGRDRECLKTCEADCYDECTVMCEEREQAPIGPPEWSGGGWGCGGGCGGCGNCACGRGNETIEILSEN